MNWKRKLMALLLAAVAIFGVACGDGGGDADDDTTEETGGY
jgi:hypothetical protein